MTTKRELEYKPLLYTTTVRNPERFKDLMFILKRYDGQILTNDLIRNFECDLFVCGLYRPMRLPESVQEKWSTTDRGELSEIALTAREASEVYNMNDPLSNPSIAGHKEAGFDKGWPSRFDTQLKLMKVLGFVYYAMGEPISFSQTGNYLAQIVNITIENDIVNRSIINPEYEQLVFLQAFARQQRCNPFIRELNDNIPLILLLQVIERLNNNPRFNNAGIARHELPLLIFWKDNNADALYERICHLRRIYGYSPSDEVIVDICTNEILGGYKSFKPRSIMAEYPDEFIRKMRLTGLISIRGAGRFIDINHLEDAKVNYVINTYSNYQKYSNERAYFDYMSQVDPTLFDIQRRAIDVKDSEKLLSKWTAIYDWESVKRELALLSNRSMSKDEVLKFIPAPARLEFLSALSIKMQLPHVHVVPNYPCDDEGLPTSTAGGDRGDICCYEGQRGILVEVTMSTGRTQTMMEVWPIARHLEAFSANVGQAVGYFVAPSIYPDSLDQLEFVEDRRQLRFKALSIADFVGHLENATNLYY